MAIAYAFTKEDMTVDQSLGYPKAYAKLCKDTSLSPYIHGPPFSFTPYILHPQEVPRAKELDEMFPIIDPQARATAKPRIFVSVLWKQLNHLGNAGFDPAMFRVDPYGNVLYFHADSASPLAWDIDHWFPCSRGGLTVLSNLRILQWQVCKRKHNQLEFLVPWWDLQLGISINQFLSIFASSNSDFRHRAFRWLFSGGESEELNDLQTVDSHNFPHPFMDSKDQLGLAPAAIVRTRRESCETSSSTLRSLDINRQPRPSTPIIAATRKFKNGGLKENEMPDMVTNPYQAIVMARDSLKQREENNKMKAEIQRMDDEMNELKQKNEEEKLTIQELELALIKRRRKTEKCRRLAEAQSSYRAMLENMIRNAMHQNVVYKQQARLNQAANNALKARLEEQMAICNSAERDLHNKFKKRDDLEKQVIPERDQARKRSRTDDDHDDDDDRKLIYLPRMKANKTPLHKELRLFLEEEHKLSEEEIEERLQLHLGKELIEDHGELLNAIEGTSEIAKDTSITAITTTTQLNPVQIGKDTSIKFPFAREPEIEEDEESRKERGKGNVEKWLQFLLENTEGGDELSPKTTKTDEIIKKLNEKYPQKEIKVLKFPESEKRTHEEIVEIEATKPRSISTPRRSISSEAKINGKGGEIMNKFNGKYPQKEIKVIKTRESKRSHEEIIENEAAKIRSMSTPRRSISSEVNINGKGSEMRKSFGGGWKEKEKGISRSESFRIFKPIPSSPSMILNNMTKGVDCIRKKPLVIDDNDDDHYGDENHAVVGNNFLKSSIKSIKKVVKI